MPAGLLQFEVVEHVVSRCMHRMFLTADTRSFKDSLSEIRKPDYAANQDVVSDSRLGTDPLRRRRMNEMKAYSDEA